MLRSSLVAGYLDTLGRELSYDPLLSRRVRLEVEDHLWEAAANEGGDAAEAQRKAIEKFGDPREIARQYAALSIFSQIRRVAVIVVLALVGIFLSMRGRSAWYSLMQWGFSDQTQFIGAIGVSVTRYAFMLAFAIGLVGCAYIGSCRAPTGLHQAYCEQMRRSTTLCVLAGYALLTSVAVDVMLTTLHLLETKYAAAALIPILSAGVEIALLGLLFLNIRVAIRRTDFVSSFLHPPARV
jgi:HAAS domain-containing protein